MLASLPLISRAAKTVWYAHALRVGEESVAKGALRFRAEEVVEDLGRVGWTRYITSRLREQPVSTSIMQPTEISGNRVPGSGSCLDVGQALKDT